MLKNNRLSTVEAVPNEGFKVAQIICVYEYPPLDHHDFTYTSRPSSE